MTLCIKSCLKNILIRAAVLCLIPWEFFLTITLYFSIFFPTTACQNSSHKNCLGTSAQVPALSACLEEALKVVRDAFKKIPLFGKVSQQGGRGQPKIPTLFFEKVGNFSQGGGGVFRVNSQLLEIKLLTKNPLF